MNDSFQEYISIIKSKEIYTEKLLVRIEKDVEKIVNKISNDLKKNTPKSLKERKTIIIPFKGMWVGKDKQIIKKNKNESLFFNIELPKGEGHEITNVLNIYNNQQEEDVYIGNYHYGLYQGLGRKIYFSEKDIGLDPFSTPSYVGEWNCGVKHGLGISTQSASTYRGYIKYGRPDGFGTFIGEYKTTGWTVNGVPFMFSIDIHSDAKNRFITDENKPSGLYVWEGGPDNLKKTLLHQFKNEKEYNDIKIIKDKRKLTETNMLTRTMVNSVSKDPRFSKEESLNIFSTKIRFTMDLYQLFQYVENYKVKKSFMNKLMKFISHYENYYETTNMFYLKNTNKKSRKIMKEQVMLLDFFWQEMRNQINK